MIKKLLILSIVFYCSCTVNEKPHAVKFPEGGYRFPVHPDEKAMKFFFYPVKDLLSPRDSFHDAFYLFHLFESLQEPNLSVYPAPKPIIRFTYFGWTIPACVITLSEGLIQVKEAYSAAYLHRDESQLTEKEKKHLQLLEHNYPLDRTQRRSNAAYRAIMDSLLKDCPRLADPDYYRCLLDKAVQPNGYSAGSYAFRQFPVPLRKYYRVVEQINLSGFWKMPVDAPCADTPNDGFTFILEINTGTRYGIVKARSCGDELTPFVKACGQLVSLAQMEDKIKLVLQ